MPVITFPAVPWPRYFTCQRQSSIIGFLRKVKHILACAKLLHITLNIKTTIQIPIWLMESPWDFGNVAAMHWNAFHYSASCLSPI